MKCYFCEREAEDVEALKYKDKKTPPLCDGCLKKVILFYLEVLGF